VSIADPDGVGYQKLELWDANGTVGGGQFVVNGADQTGGHEIDVSPTDVAKTVFDVGTLRGTDTLWARVLQTDGTLTKWQRFTVRAVPSPMPPPVVQTLGSLPGTDLTQAYAVSADGSVVVGSYRVTINNNTTIQPFRWTAATGIVGLGPPPGYSLGPPDYLSADGSVVVGTLGGPAALPFRWTAARGFIDLGVEAGAVATSPAAVDANGSVIAGGSQFGSLFQAWRWMPSTGIVGLGFLPGDTTSGANDISSDGSVIVGSSGIRINDSYTLSEPFRWTAATGMVGLGMLPGYSSSDAAAVSADGSVVVGTATNPQYSGSEAFRWTAATGMVGLGMLPGDNASNATDVSADGSVVVGTSGDEFGGGPGRAYRWTAILGMQSIRDILVANGTDLSGFSLISPTGVSADGTVIVGGDGTQACIVRIPLNAFALLDLKGLDVSIGSLLWGGIVTNSGTSIATLTAGSDNSNTTFNGTIQDGVSTTALTKIGTGTLTLTGANSYTGGTTIAAGTLELGSGASIRGGVTFSGTTGTLKLDNSSSFAGTVAGISDQDTIDFADIDFANVQRPSYSGTPAGGTLSVTDGTHSANIALLGNYLASTFVASGDGHGGTNVVDPPATNQTLLLTQPQH
jgi:autotransporter-associated beta strand protein/probable HAF family extracellular repeat protein